MQTKTINGILCRRVMPGEVIKEGDFWGNGAKVEKYVGRRVSPGWSELEYSVWRNACRQINRTPSGTEAKVCSDIAARQAKGIAKYGTTVADNPLSRRQWLQHAYEEALDLAVYLKKEIDAES